MTWCCSLIVYMHSTKTLNLNLGEYLYHEETNQSFALFVITSVWKVLEISFDMVLFCSLQLLRKRHIGNDIVTIVFQEPGAKAFSPKNIRSHFQHVFVVVRAHNPCSDSTCYR